MIRRTCLSSISFWLRDSCLVLSGFLQVWPPATAVAAKPKPKTAPAAPADMFTIVSDNIEVLQESPTPGPRPTRGRPKSRPGSNYVTPPEGTMTIVDFSPQPLASTLANQLNQRLGAESKSTGLLCNAGSRVASKPLIGITSSCTTTAKAGGTHCMRASVRVRVVRVRARLMMLAEMRCMSGEL